MLWREVQTCSILHGVISHKMIPPAGFCWTYFFHPEDGGDVPPKRRSKLNGLHGVISHKIKLPAGFRWTYFFHPEDGGGMFLRNVGWNSRSNIWNMTPCSPLSFNRRFGVTYCFHLQGGRNKFSKNQQAVSSCGIWRRVVRWVWTEVSEEHIASIFRVEK
jgi:hypothetical protein